MERPDFSKYSKGLHRMERFFTWPRVILLLVVAAALAAWANYNDLVLVLMLFALAFTSVEGNFLRGLINDDVKSVRSEVEALRDAADGRFATIEAVVNLRGQLSRLSETVEACGLEDVVRLLRRWAAEPESMRGGSLADELDSMRKVIHALSEAEGRLAHVVVDAVERIDSQALRTVEDVRTDPRPRGYQPSITRLEGEIAKLRQEVEALRGNHQRE